MGRSGRNVFIGASLIAGLAIGGGALVKAQQGAPPAHAAVSDAPVAEEPPPSPDALSGAVDMSSAPPAEAADVEPAPVAAAPAQSAAKPAAPLKRPRYTSAVLQAIDKVTAQTLRFEVPIGKPVRYKSLIFVVRACETTAADEPFTDAAAHVEIDSQPLPQDGSAPPPARQVFRGWMFANAPGVDLFQHPVYDAWLIACKTEAPSA
ncbi:MAG TPA: DUF2155 domain-containing protein [Caulobacteraceae bacterium]|jgi:hypothetical protein|nr:DUF2155 domain-containing protein [Caulobacteraceae bacterium]